MEDMELGDITEVLEGMELGEAIAFPNGALAERTEDGWAITLPSEGRDLRRLDVPEPYRPGYGGSNG